MKIKVKRGATLSTGRGWEYFPRAARHGQGDAMLPPDVVELDRDFYAVLRFFSFHGGDADERPAVNEAVWYWEVLAGPKEISHVPVLPMGLNMLLRTAEWQGPGIVDGLWRVEIWGDYLSVRPIPRDLA